MRQSRKPCEKLLGDTATSFSAWVFMSLCRHRSPIVDHPLHHRPGLLRMTGRISLVIEAGPARAQDPYDSGFQAWCRCLGTATGLTLLRSGLLPGELAGAVRVSHRPRISPAVPRSLSGCYVHAPLNLFGLPVPVGAPAAPAGLAGAPGRRGVPAEGTRQAASAQVLAFCASTPGQGIRQAGGLTLKAGPRQPRTRRPDTGCVPAVPRWLSVYGCVRQAKLLLRLRFRSRSPPPTIHFHGQPPAGVNSVARSRH